MPILWILILIKVLYSFLISSLTIAQIMIVELAIKRLIGTGTPKPFVSVICFSLWNYILNVTLGITWLQSSTPPRAAFSASIMQLASPEKHVLLHWHCMNSISLFTNVVQPNLKKNRFWKNNLFAEVYYDRILNITRVCTFYNICHIYLYSLGYTWIVVKKINHIMIC